ncbi:MAG: hypothetical protein EXS64_09505 [Candidatus Latescibacteria bacterium]|nr:hypothetical protein [Candidatus Latescibacterota bacterium]
MSRFAILAPRLIIALLTVEAGRASAEPETVTLTILHTNDLSGDLKGLRAGPRSSGRSWPGAVQSSWTRGTASARTRCRPTTGGRRWWR